jgi:hypothetical protein
MDSTNWAFFRYRNVLRDSSVWSLVDSRFEEAHCRTLQLWIQATKNAEHSEMGWTQG